MQEHMLKYWRKEKMIIEDIICIGTLIISIILMWITIPEDRKDYPVHLQ